MKVMSAAMRCTIGPGWVRKVLATGNWPDKVPTDKRTIPRAGGNEAEAVERLRTAANRLQHHNGEFKPSPLFGQLDKESWLQLHRLHAAHHLGFLIPEE